MRATRGDVNVDFQDCRFAQGAYNESIIDSAKEAQLQYESWLDSIYQETRNDVNEREF